jgi:hypothetical protein
LFIGAHHWPGAADSTGCWQGSVSFHCHANLAGQGRG